MLIIIPVKLVDFNSNTQGTHKTTFWNVFTKSRAINLETLNKSTIKPQGAQLHIPTYIYVKFHDSRSNTS
jgi:hypothetical protein